MPIPSPPLLFFPFPQSNTDASASVWRPTAPQYKKPRWSLFKFHATVPSLTIPLIVFSFLNTVYLHRWTRPHERTCQIVHMHTQPAHIWDPPLRFSRTAETPSFFSRFIYIDPRPTMILSVLFFFFSPSVTGHFREPERVHSAILFISVPRNLRKKKKN